jgi:hypothetical protein
VNGRIACGSMVLFLSFSQKFGSASQIFVKKKRIFRAASGDIPCHMRDRRISLSSGRFAGFVHFVVFVVQTPTA